jgi:CheY-like chemotaxis protein
VQSIFQSQKGWKITASAYDEKNRILLVEDEPEIAYLVKTGLEHDGFEGDGHTNPILALQNF